MKNSIQTIDALVASTAELKVDGNPFTTRHTNRAILEYVVAQYTLFPKEIVRFLTRSRDAARRCGLKTVELELSRNIGEELGSDSVGITHYEMLEGTLQVGLGLSVRHTISSKATSSFLGSVEDAINGSNSSLSLGAAYALEATARPELLVVKVLLERLSEDFHNKPLANGLRKFLDKHINVWEPGHQEGLKQALLQSHGVCQADFVCGAQAVLSAMGSWWHGLYDECQVS